MNFMMEENQMSKKLKAVLSFALALVLVMSLGVSAFADRSNAETEKEKEPEIVQIAFNLGTMEPCAVRMRELGYDDIRLDGVSYKADAEDGVIAIQLGDLAAAKLLRENTDKAKELGIDYANLYIRGGKVLVKDDTGLTSDQIAALQQAVASLMSSVRVGVNIGDIFDLANGEKVKLRVQVCNFIYPAPKDDSIKVKVVDEKNAEKLLNFDKDKNPISAKVPEKTTVYFSYNVATIYKIDKEASTGAETKYKDGEKVDSLYFPSRVGIARDKNDKTTYYIQLGYAEGKRDGIEEATDLTTTKDATSFGEAMRALYDKALGWAKTVFVSTDKDGKNVVKTIDIKDATPDASKALAGKAPAGYKDETGETDPYTMYTPDKSAEVTHDKGDKAEVTVKDVLLIQKEGNTDTDISTTSLENEGDVASNASPATDGQKTEADATKPAPHEHKWGEGVVKSKATCETNGVTTYTCTECGEQQHGVIPAKGHSFVNGVCSVCGAKDPAYTPAPAADPAPALEPTTPTEPTTAQTPEPASATAPTLTAPTPTSDGSESGGSADAGNGGGESGGGE